MKRRAISAVLVLAAAGALAVAQAQKPGAPRDAARAARGNEAATQSSAPGVQQCVACHGAQGLGNPQGGIPRIAGQPEAYLRKQLDSYADGSRRNAVMQPIAKALSREARAAGAAYYTALSPAGTPGAPAAQGAKADATTGTESRPSRGEELATVGDERTHVQSCGNCHGPGGVGEPPSVPYLAGQDAAYLIAALNEFRSGARRNDAGAQMRTVVDGMSAEDIASVAQYYARLAPPAQRATPDIVRAPGTPPLTAATAARGSSRGGAASSTQPSGGAPGAVGSEQGAGTSGGTQGAGGTDQGSRIDKPAPAKGR